MKIFFIAIIALIMTALAGAIFLKKPNAAPVSSDPNIIAVGGMHSHPQLEIYVKGEPMEIPQNVGIGTVHRPIHTHDDLPIIHLEFPGLVRKSDIALGRFFEIWGRDMRSFGSNMRMNVNGAVNTEYENYIMRDGDKIELHYD